MIRPDIALIAVAVIAALLVLWMAVRLKGLRADNARLKAASEQGREILAAAPDGLFLWDHAEVEERCSRRLAVLLDLSAGTGARFTDVLARFETPEAITLKNAVDDLHRNGTSFDIKLKLDKRTIQATGSRASSLDGRPLDDLMWMRDVSNGAVQTIEPAKAKASDDAFEHFRVLLDALPCPVWIRDPARSVVFRNHAAQGLDLDARQAVDTHGQPMDVSEVPARAWAGTIGFAVPAGAPAVDENLALEHLSIAVVIFGSDTRHTYSNVAFRRLWGLEAGWLADDPSMGEIFERLREKRHLPEVADFRAFREQQVALFRTVKEPQQSLLHLPDGRTVSQTVSPHSDGGLVFSFEDVSDKLDLERSFKSLNAVQRETLDNLYEGVCVFGSDGKLKLSNPSFAAIWNLDAASLNDTMRMADFLNATRSLISDADKSSDEDWKSHVATTVAKLGSRQPSNGRIRLNNGTILDYSSVPLPDGAVLLGYLDVSDSARVEGALRQRAEALDQANRLKSEFIANVSHEIRTPLTSLIGFADVLTQESHGKLNARQMEYSTGIMDSAKGLERVINDILDLASIEAGMMSLQLDTVDVHSMLVSVLNLIKESARRKNLEVEFDCPPDIGWIVADEKRLKQVLFNLLSNAVNFTPPRGTIILASERSGDGDDAAVNFRVTDTGRGMPKAEQLDIFGAFERTGGNDQSGAGLGLSLVQRFVELHGGDVEVKSPPGKGSTVICTLPAGGSKRSDISIVTDVESA
ncbi:MAG: histidine kinase [Rhodospirillaceae bacterium]|nr:histidine kinase [Rhodospirillaceae bacterium]MBT4464446.1 histidine kinase [Rhodospirillaceae bacterium]MBT5014331.1 histidine kinase [Rhodospirillaceae bacterium]